MNTPPLLRKRAKLGRTNSDYRSNRLSQSDLVPSLKKELALILPQEVAHFVSPRRKQDDETFILRISNEEFSELLKSRLFTKRTSIPNTKSTTNVVVKPQISVKRKYTKAHAKMVPQLAPRGYPNRWSKVTFYPCINNDSRIDKQTPQYGYALGIFKGSNMALFSSLIAVVPLDDVKVEKISDNEVVIRQNYSNQVMMHDFFFKVVSEAQKDAWLKVIERESNTQEEPSFKQFPISYSTFYDVTALRASCLLSEDSIFQSVMVTTDDGAIEKWELQAATLQDLFEYSLLQSQPNASILIIDCILLYFRMKSIPFTLFYKLMKETWKNHTIARRKGDLNAKHFKWKLLLQYFGEHVACSYVLVPLKERDRIVRFCAKEIGTAATDAMKLYLSSYTEVTDQTALLSVHKTISVHPTWDVQEQPSFDNISTRTLAEQITLLETLHHQYIKPEELLESNKNLAEDSALKLASAWWNKISFWVAGEILKQPTAKLQMKNLKKYFKLAKRLFTIRNYSSCAQILAGINHNAVQRIKKLREIITPKLRDEMEDLSQNFSHRDNYRRYRKLNHQSPFLCFLPVFQRDIIHIMDGNTEFVDNDHKLVNVDRMKMLIDIIHKTGFLNPRYHFNFSFTKDSAIMSIFLQSRFTEDELYVISEQHEPNRSSCQIETISTETKTILNPLFASDDLRNLLERNAKPPSNVPPLRVSQVVE